MEVERRLAGVEAFGMWVLVKGSDSHIDLHAHLALPNKHESNQLEWFLCSIVLFVCLIVFLIFF